MKRKTTGQFIEDAVRVHGDIYSYELTEYINSHIDVDIICSNHGIFKQKPYHHLQGSGCLYCSKSVSKSEIELQQWLKQYIDIKTNNRQLIHPLELDIVIPSKKIAIEYNGLYWHSESRGKDRRYHKNKYELCKEKGYRLIQIWEDEWLFKKDIVKSRLKHIIGLYDKTIYARKCTIREVSPSQARPFIDKHHIQGYTGCSVKLGLYHDTEDDFGIGFDELVAVMTFAKPSISKGNKTKEGSFELSRFCSSCKVTDAGGKLLKYFTRNYDVSYILTYADLRWSDGNLYNAIGFDFVSYTPTNYYYVVDGKRKHRFNYRKNVLNEKLDIFDPNLTEYQNMLNNDIDRVWDCGNLKFAMNL